MFALLLLLGVGLVASAFVGGSDDVDEETAEQTFGDDDDNVSDREYRPNLISSLDDLVAEGEITQAEADETLASVVFTDGAQNLATGGGDDLVLGSPANDRIATGTGDDAAVGGLGNDIVLLGDGDDTYGSDFRTIVSPDDIQTITSSFFSLGPDAQLEGGDDTVKGGDGDDFIADGYGANRLVGGQGRDIIVSVDADDLSPDRVDGGRQDDALFVDQGDTVTGGPGDDWITVDLFDGVTQGYALVTVTDFMLGSDVLELEGSSDLLRTPTPSGPDDVVSNPITVADTDNGAIVSVGGVPVFLVIGGQGMMASDIRIST